MFTYAALKVTLTSYRGSENNLERRENKGTLRPTQPQLLNICSGASGWQTNSSCQKSEALFKWLKSPLSVRGTRHSVKEKGACVRRHDHKQQIAHLWSSVSAEGREWAEHLSALRCESGFQDRGELLALLEEPPDSCVRERGDTQHTHAHELTYIKKTRRTRTRVFHLRQPNKSASVFEYGLKLVRAAIITAYNRDA